MNKSNRIEWIDISRGLCFIMVLYSHLICSNREVMIFFAPMYLSVFFVVSGYLFKNNTSFKDCLIHRFKTLMIPFLIYGSLLMGLRYVISFTGTPETPFFRSFIDMITQNGNDNFIWFVPSLFVFSLIFWVIDRFTDNNFKIISVACMSFLLNWILVYRFSLPYLPYAINTAGFACAYMCIGKYIKMNSERINITHPSFLLSIISLLYVFIVWKLDIWVSYDANVKLFYSIIILIMGIYICISFSSIIHSKLLSFIGRNSLLYFILHGKAISVVQFGVNKVEGLLGISRGGV